MSATPISDAIDSLANGWSSAKYEDFLHLLNVTPVGIFAPNVKPAAVERVVEHSPPGMVLAVTDYGDKMRLQAYADPREFIRKFGGPCNGEMLGSELFKVVLHNSACQGVLLNSALSEISFPVEREDIQRFVRTRSFSEKVLAKVSWWRKRISSFQGCP